MTFLSSPLLRFLVVFPIILLYRSFNFLNFYRCAELHVVEGTAEFNFVQTVFSVATEEAERIGVDQVAKLLPSGNAAGTDQRKNSTGQTQ